MHERHPSPSSLPLALWGTYQLIHHVVSLSVFPANVSNSLTLPANHITNHTALSVVMDIMHGELYIIAGPYHQRFPLRIKQFLDHKCSLLGFTVHGCWFIKVFQWSYHLSLNKLITVYSSADLSLLLALLSAADTNLMIKPVLMPSASCKCPKTFLLCLLLSKMEENHPVFS